MFLLARRNAGGGLSVTGTSDAATKEEAMADFLELFSDPMWVIEIVEGIEGVTAVTRSRVKVTATFA